MQTWSKSSLYYDSLLGLAVRISMSIDLQLKELPGAITLGGWSPEGATSALGFVLTALVVRLLDSCPVTELGGANRLNHCWLLAPNVTERSVETELPAELDLLWVQKTLDSAVWATSSRVAGPLASALAPLGGAPSVAELTPKVASLSKLWETSSTSMSE